MGSRDRYPQPSPIILESELGYYTVTTHTYQFACTIPKNVADALNQESARIYNAVMVEHWRIYRKKAIWLSQSVAEKLNDFYDSYTSKLLHSHSIDAAQQAFYKACKTVRTLRKNGDETARYPYKRRRYRTTVWKNTGVNRVEGGVMHLSLAHGLDRLQIQLPPHLALIEKQHIAEVRLVFNKSTFRYSWHVVADDGIEVEPKGVVIAGVDLGEIHPVAITDGVESCVIACRELRALNQGRNKRVAAIDAKLAKYRKGSRRWRKLKKRKRHYLAQVKQQKRDIEHKIARETITWAQEREIGVLALGDVRDIADGKRLSKQIQQKISNWSHGTIRKYIVYKAAEVGIQVKDDIPEKYTSQTCPTCRKLHKPKGRVYKCPHCGSVFHRDIVGAANIASRYEFDELGRYPAPKPKYRYPVNVRGKRSPIGTGDMAR
jgi:putative transposase